MLLKLDTWEDNPGANYFLLAVFSFWKSYRLAWNINNILDFKISRLNDIDIELESGVGYITNYSFIADNFHFKLLENKIYKADDKLISYLSDNFKKCDFFIIIRDEIGDFDIENFIKKLKILDGVDYTIEITNPKLKYNDKFLFCLE